MFRFKAQAFCMLLLSLAANYSIAMAKESARCNVQLVLDLSTSDDPDGVASITVNGIRIQTGSDNVTEGAAFMVASLTPTCTYIQAKTVELEEAEDFYEEVVELLSITPTGGYAIMVSISGNHPDMHSVFQEDEEELYDLFLHDIGGIKWDDEGYLQSRYETREGIGVDEESEEEPWLGGFAYVIRKGYPDESFVKFAPYLTVPRIIEFDIDIEDAVCLEPLSPLDPVLFDPNRHGLAMNRAAGPGSTDNDLGTKLQLVYGDPIGCEGKVYGWEYIPDKAGEVNFAVFRPDGNETWDLLLYEHVSISESQVKSGSIQYISSTNNALVKPGDRYAVYWTDRNPPSSYPVRRVHNLPGLITERFPCSRQLLEWELTEVKYYEVLYENNHTLVEPPIDDRLMALAVKPILDDDFVYKRGCTKHSDCWTGGDINMLCNGVVCICAELYVYHRKSNKCLLDVFEFDSDFVLFQSSIFRDDINYDAESALGDPFRCQESTDLGPHTMACLRHWWLDSGCNLYGSRAPDLNPDLWSWQELDESAVQQAMEEISRDAQQENENARHACYGDCPRSRPLLCIGQNAIANMYVSSEYTVSYDHGPEYSCLDTPAVSGVHSGSWTAASDDTKPWIAARFEVPHMIERVTTQGRADFSQWVKTYKLEYGNAGQEQYVLTDQGNERVFQGNTDRNTKVSHDLPVNLIANYVKLHVVSYNSHASMRWELYGCVANDLSLIVDEPHQARTEIEANPWIAAEFSHVLTVYSVEILTPKPQDYYVDLWESGDVVSDPSLLTSPDLRLSDEDYDGSLSGITSIVIHGSEPWLLKSADGSNYVILNRQLNRGDSIFTANGDAGSNFGSVGSTSDVSLTKLPYYGYMVEADSTICWKLNEEEEKFDAYNYSRGVIRECSVFYVEESEDVPGEFYIRKIEQEGLALRVTSLLVDSVVTFGSDTTTWVLNSGASIDSLLEESGVVIKPSEGLSVCLKFINDELRLSTACPGFYLKPVIDESVERYRYETVEISPDDEDVNTGCISVNVSDPYGEITTRPCYEIVNVVLNDTSDTITGPPYGAAICDVKQNDDLEVLVYNASLETVEVPTKITYRYNDVGVHTFSVWVSDRPPVPDAPIQKSQYHSLCSRFDGAAKNGHYLKLDCDTPVTGKYVIIQVDSENDNETLEISDWKIHALVAKKTCLESGGHPLIAGELYLGIESLFGGSRQADLRDIFALHSISTRGAGDSVTSSYTVSYSKDGTDYRYISTEREGESEHLQFDAYFENDTEVTHVFPYTIEARFVRIYPKTDIDFIWEVYGCPLDEQKDLYWRSCYHDAQCYDGYDHAQLYCDDPDSDEYGGRCECRDGFTYDHHSKLCIDEDECFEDLRCGKKIHDPEVEDGTCRNTYGSYICTCEEGYQWEDSSGCVDIDECEEKTSGCHHFCNNTVPGFECSCDIGFVLDDETEYRCIDIDECAQPSNPCQGTTPSRTLKPGICHNTYGSFTCTCSRGYRWNNGDGMCEDVNECAEEIDFCGDQCINRVVEEFPLGYECTCRQEGFELSTDAYSCVDINECDGANACDNLQRAQCVNTVGSYTCKCPEGSDYDGSTCADYDECTDGTHLCEMGCRNLRYTYECYCDEGYHLAANGKGCIDDNECDEQICGGNTYACVNVPGSFHCMCETGYERNEDTNSCTDINECEEDNGGCMHICRNTPGSRECRCEDGYELLSDGTSCDDVDECELDLHNCDGRQFCVNTASGFDCYCVEGFESNDGGVTCDDMDECQHHNSGCQHNCKNTEGSFLCSCKDGFILLSDARSCHDTNECAQGNGGCEQTCINTPGSYQCTCQAPFKLDTDGKRCQGENSLKLRISLDMPYIAAYADTTSAGYGQLKTAVEANFASQICNREPIRNIGVTVCKVVGPFLPGSVKADIVLVTSEVLNEEKQSELSYALYSVMGDVTEIAFNGTKVKLSTGPLFIYSPGSGQEIVFEVTSPCDFYEHIHYCMNDGECRVGRDGVPECKCTNGYTGSRCDDEDDALSMTEIALIITIGVLGITVFCLIICFCWLAAKAPDEDESGPVPGPRGPHANWWNYPPAYGSNDNYIYDPYGKY